jgi:hypothetical protein
MMVTDATSAYSIFDTCRLNWVEIWAVCENASRTVDIALEFPGIASRTGSRSVRHTDSMIGSGAHPLHIRASPPKNSYQSFWQSYGDIDAFHIFMSVECYIVVDVNISFVISDSGAAGTAFTVSGATEGAVVYGALDSGATIGPTNLPLET